MVAIAGRAIEFEWNALPVLGVREKGITLNGEAINITSDEDNGWQTLLDVSAEDSVELALSGVTKDERLKTDWFAKTRMRPATITWPNGSTLTGTFYLSTMSFTGPYNDAETFEATIMSHGEVTFTPYS